MVSLRSFEGKFTVLKKVLVTLLGLFGASISNSAPPQWFSAPIVNWLSGNCAPLRYAPGWHGSNSTYFIDLYHRVCQNNIRNPRPKLIFFISCFQTNISKRNCTGMFEEPWLYQFPDFQLHMLVTTNCVQTPDKIKSALYLMVMQIISSSTETCKLNYSMIYNIIKIYHVCNLNSLNNSL